MLPLFEWCADLAKFFRAVKHRQAELAELFDHEVVHAEHFRELRDSENPSCELQRALRFAYLVWYIYGAKGTHFAGSSAKGCLRSNGRMCKPLGAVPQPWVE